MPQVHEDATLQTIRLGRELGVRGCSRLFPLKNIEVVDEFFNYENA